AARKIDEQARGAAIVAEDLITAHTVPLVNKLLALARAGDRAALRFCVERIAPPPRRRPLIEALPLEANGDVRAAIAIVADAAAAGVITSAQAAMLARMLLAVLCDGSAAAPLDEAALSP